MSKFNLQTELQKAWDWCWKFYCEPSPCMPYGTKKGVVKTLPPRQTWLCASDLERRIRAAAREALDNVPAGTYGQDGTGNGVRITTGFRGGLLDAVRDWLRNQLAQRKLEAHNFGRGHCSGMRFRPVGMGVPVAEAKHIQERRDRLDGKDNRPIHFRDPAKQGSWKPVCIKARPRSAYSSHRSKSSARLTNDREKVTCPRCQKLVAALPPPKFTVRFYLSEADMPGSVLSEPIDVSDESDEAIEEARRQCEATGRQLEIEPKTDFPGFILYRDGTEIGGG